MRRFWKIILFLSVALVGGMILRVPSGRQESIPPIKSDSTYYIRPTPLPTPTFVPLQLPPFPQGVYWSEEANISDGTYDIEACRNGRCYTLEADIYDGVVETIYFPNGGHLNLDVELDEDGYGYATDYHGDEWEIDASEYVEESDDYFGDF